MNSNTTNLGVIMACFGLNSRNLADLLNIHYSLVSKWLNDKRPLKSNSHHLKKLVEVFLSIDNSHQRHTLRMILKDSFPDADITSKEKMAVYLAQFLTSASEELQPTELNGVQTGHVFAKAKIDVYKKPSGRRDALVRLLDTAIALAPGQELLLYSQEDFSWHYDDEAFAGKWFDKYNELLQKGIKVTMVHTVDRKAPHLLHTISQWLPLHLTGKTNAYYLPEYTNSHFKPSISLLRGRAAMTGMTAEGFSDELYTYFIQDESTLRHLGVVFDALLSQCRPMFEKLDSDNISTKMLETVKRAHTSYNMTPLPLCLALEHGEMSDILADNGIAEERFDKCLRYYDQYRSYLMESLKNAPFNQVFDLTMVEEGIREGLTTSEFNWIAGANLHIAPGLFKRGLTRIIALLNQCPNFALALADEYPLPNTRSVSLLIRENTAVVANSRTAGIPFPLIMKEPTIVRTFFQYLEHCWGSVPRVQRNKDSVIYRLKQMTK